MRGLFEVKDQVIRRKQKTHSICCPDFTCALAAGSESDVQAIIGGSCS
jgi:hypothetical protein